MDKLVIGGHAQALLADEKTGLTKDEKRHIGLMLHVVAKSGEPESDTVTFADVEEFPFPCRQMTILRQSGGNVESTSAFTTVFQGEVCLLHVRKGAGLGPKDRTDIIRAYEHECEERKVAPDAWKGRTP